MCLTRVLSPVAVRRKASRFAAVPILIVALHVAAGAVTFERAWRIGLGGSGRTVEQTSDGGYIVGSYAVPDAHKMCIALLKTDSLGDTLWTRLFGGRRYPDSVQGYGGGSACAMRSGYAIRGNAFRQETWIDVIVFGTNLDGDSVWNYQYIGPDDDNLSSLAGTFDGGLIGTGVFTGLPVENMTFVKFDSVGSLQWLKVVNVEVPTCGWRVVQTRDSGFCAVGTADTGQAWVLSLVKLDAAGDSQWVQTYDNPVAYLAYGLANTHDNGFVLAGPWMYGACIMRTNQFGESLWTRHYRVDGYDSTERRVRVDGFYADGRAVAETHDHGFIIAGRTAPRGGFPQPLLLIRTDSLGETLWTRRFLPPFAQTAIASDVKQTTDGGFVITGDADNRYIYLIKTDSMGRVAAGTEEPPAVLIGESALRAQPNPFSACVMLSSPEKLSGKAMLDIYDCTGSLVLREQFSGRTAWSGTDETGRALPSGVYVARAVSPGRVATVRLILSR